MEGLSLRVQLGIDDGVVVGVNESVAVGWFVGPREGAKLGIVWPV